MEHMTKPAADVLDRPSAVRSVLASFQMEGLVPDAETAALLRQYAAGSMSLEQFGLEIDRHVARIRSEITVQGAA
jgi:hypothetical protein